MTVRRDRLGQQTNVVLAVWTCGQKVKGGAIVPNVELADAPYRGDIADDPAYPLGLFSETLACAVDRGARQVQYGDRMVRFKRRPASGDAPPPTSMTDPLGANSVMRDKDNCGSGWVQLTSESPLFQ